MLTVYKETISNHASWTGGGPMVVMEEGSRRQIHASVCSPLGNTRYASGKAAGYTTDGIGSSANPRATHLCHFNVTGLEQGRIYAFRVRAHNPVGWGEFSHASGHAATLRKVSSHSPRASSLQTQNPSSRARLPVVTSCHASCACRPCCCVLRGR